MTSPSDPWPLPLRGPLKPMDGTALCSTCPEQLGIPCGQPATWHVAWTLEGGVATSFACDPHMTAIQTAHVYSDRHPLGAACPLPGMTWWGPHGRCALDLDSSHNHLEEIPHAHH
jgi:hypothetical protein